MAPSTILLKNGTLLLHEGPDDRVVPTKADLLISGNIIARIDQGILDREAQEVIDCTDKIVSPGFVDAHQHVWQTQLKGRHANQLFLDYMASGFLQSANYTREDFFWGQLGGCLELLNAGTTTVVDHAHMNTTPEASPTALSATLSSGIRSLFCYAPILPPTSFNPLTFPPPPATPLSAPWLLPTLSALSARCAAPGSRVTLGLAYDSWHLPAAASAPLFAAAQRLGVAHLTAHMCHGRVGQGCGLPALLIERGLLGAGSKKEAEGGGGGGEGREDYAPFPHVLLSHAAGATQEDLSVMARHGAHVVSTPGTELQMGLGGASLCFSSGEGDDNEDGARAARGIACLGGDCHSNGGASMPGAMRLVLQAARGARRVGCSVEEAFNLGTVRGARAVGMEGRVGKLAVGMLADVVVFEGRSPAMVCAAQEDPVAAVVLHSGPGDVETVVVDGVVRKRGGRLVEAEVDGEARGLVGGRERVGWEDIARELLKSRERIQEKVGKIDLEEAKQALMKTWYIGPSNVVDEI